MARWMQWLWRSRTRSQGSRTTRSREESTMSDRRREQDTRLTTADVARSEARTTVQVRDDARPRDDARWRDDSRWMPPRHDDDAAQLLLPQDELGGLQAKWQEIMARFVDEPRQSVEDADGLVANTIRRLAESFADTRSRLES